MSCHAAALLAAKDSAGFLPAFVIQLWVAWLVVDAWLHHHLLLLN